MKAKASLLFTMLGGHLRHDQYYARRSFVPGEFIIQRRPKCRKQVNSEARCKTLQVARLALKRTKEEYNNPELRAIWQERYNELLRKCQKKGNRYMSNGKEVPWRLYDYVRQQIFYEVYKEVQEHGDGTERN